MAEGDSIEEDLENTALVMSLRSSYGCGALELATSEGDDLFGHGGQRDSLGSWDPSFTPVFDRSSSSWPNQNFGGGRRTSYFGNPLWGDRSAANDRFYYENTLVPF